MRGWMWFGVAVAMSACTSSGGGKDDTDVAVDDTDTVGGDTDVVVEDTDIGDTDVPGDCAVDADLGALALNDGAMIIGDDWYTFYQAINDDLLPDFFQIEVYGGTSQFPGLPEPGTYDLSGDNAQYSTCGVCVLLLADSDGDGIPSETYLATSGTVTLTQTGPGLVGVYTDLVFEQVEIDSETYISTPVGECATTSSAGAFSGVAPL